MIQILSGLLGGRTWAAWLVVAVLSLGALGGVYAWIDHQGYARASAEWQAKYEAREVALAQQRFHELDRQAHANDAAKAREAERLAAAQAQIDALNQALLENDVAAEADPNADRIGIGADSVERLNRIR